jgi:predicted nucleotidyltransferase
MVRGGIPPHATRSHGPFAARTRSFGRVGLDWESATGQNKAMNRDQVIATLRRHERELRAAGVVRLSVFGSTVRGDRRPDSDVDLLASFDESRRLSLLDVVGIELRLADLLGQRVDLAEEGTLKQRVQQSVDSEAVRAF